MVQYRYRTGIWLPAMPGPCSTTLELLTFTPRAVRHTHSVRLALSTPQIVPKSRWAAHQTPETPNPPHVLHDPTRLAASIEGLFQIDHLSPCSPAGCLPLPALR